jgi:membrane protein YqaA with SNARE-associated domain
MGRFVHWVRSLALVLGAPGLLLVAFLDSSIFSLPEIADLLVIWMVTKHKTRFLLYVASATLGSIAGCLLLYYLGRKGGDAMMRRRFTNASIERTLAAFRRHGVMAVLIPSILPPPAPFKIFVLVAGVAGISVRSFTIAIAIGRGARYFVEGLLAVWYGERAIAFIHAHGKAAALTVLGVLAAGMAVYVLWSKARAKTHR